MTTFEELAALSADPRPYLDHEDGDIRRLAVSVVAAHPRVAQFAGSLERLLENDPSARVRAEAADALGMLGPASLDALVAATMDPDPVVVEAVATAFGEVGDRSAVPWLIDAARDHGDRLVREAAVASLGAIGDERARPVLLKLVSAGPPQIRRRSVVALTVFDGSDVEAAIRDALGDRNPMVREAAEMVAGRPVPGLSEDR